VLNVGPAEVLIILVVALLVLGPKKLPEAARQIGKAMSEFRRVTSSLQDEVRHVVNDHVESTPAVDPPPLGPALGNGDTPPAPAEPPRTLPE
jgi:sec-independent protein translocase protein TatA